jgi:hypothetical protein
MKNLSAVLFVLTGILSFSGAQAQNVEWGLKAGLQTSSLKGEDFMGVLAGSSSRTPEKVSAKGSAIGYAVGGYVRTIESVFLQGELLVSVKGAQLERESTSAKTAIQYGQLDIPLSLGYKYKHFEVSGGPLLSVQLFDNDKLKQFLSQYSLTPLNFSPYKSYSFGYQAAAGLNFNKLAFHLRYLASIQPISDMYISYNAASGELRDSHFQQSFRALQLTASYRLSK